METELMPQCGACGSRGTHKVGAATAAPAVGCHCGVIVTGFTEAEATERWERLARRAEIGRLVEEIVDAKPGLLTIGRTPCRDGSQIYSAWSSRPVGEALSLLDALRSLDKEVNGG